MIRTVLISLAVSVCVFMSGIYVYDNYYALEIHHVDMRGFAKKQQKLAVQGVISNRQLEENFNELDRKMNKLKGNAVVITSDVILKGGREIEVD